MDGGRCIKSHMLFMNCNVNTCSKFKVITKVFKVKYITLVEHVMFDIRLKLRTA